jgi:acyl carrier protein
MTPAEIVISILSAQSGVDDIKPTDTIVGLGLDSLDVIEVVMRVEEAFGYIDIPDEDAEKVVTVGDAIALVEKYMEVRT